MRISKAGENNNKYLIIFALESMHLCVEKKN